MPEIIINGIHISALPADTILTAASRAGIEIPHFCYHPELKYAGSCRMCLVEVEKSPKLVTSCNTPVSEGMVVYTETERVKKARAAVLEFLLINHPLDCPICDKAGECPLQDNYFKYSARESRYEEEKWHKNKKTDLGPLIIHDEERCILCTRCVRFMQDIAKSPQLIVAKRGSKNVLTTYPGRPFDNPYSLNTVDICPVGALTSKDFRFQCRAWYLESSKSVCPFCETGCNIIIQHKDGIVYRILPDKNDSVNGAFMCDYGRIFRKYIHSNDRILSPLIRTGKSGVTAVTAIESYDKIYSRIAARASMLAKNGDVKETGVILSPYLSVEEAYLTFKIFGEALKVNYVSLFSCEEGFDNFIVSDNYLISKNKSPDKAGIVKLADKMGVKLIAPEIIAGNAGAKKIKSVVFIGPSFGFDGFYEKNKDELDVCDFIISLTTHFKNIAFVSDYILPFLLWAESGGHFLNKNDIIQSYLPAVSFKCKTDSPDNINSICRLASCFGVKAEYASAKAVFDEITTRLKIFN